MLTGMLDNVKNVDIYVTKTISGRTLNTQLFSCDVLVMKTRYNIRVGHHSQVTLK